MADRYFHRTRPLFLLVLFNIASCVLLSPLAGQVQVRAEEQDSLAGYVSSTTRIFITINRVESLDEALGRLKPAPLARLLGVSPQKSWNLRASLAEALGPSISIDDLKGLQIGLAANSWSQLGNPIWLIRAADQEMITRWFPQHAEAGTGGESVRLFRSEDRRFVGVRGNVVALAPRAADWAQLGQILRAMAGSESDVLQRSQSYRELVPYLPGRPLLTLFYDGSSGPGRSVGGQVAVGAYLRERQLEIAVRGRKGGPVGHGPLSPAAVDRMLRLPQSTLGAYITTVDWKSLVELKPGESPTALQRYIRLIAELGTDNRASAAAPRLGKHVIVAWGQNLSGLGAAPQVAVILESPDAVHLPAAATRVSTSLARILSTLELQEVGDSFSIRESTHLGVSVSSIPLREYASKSRFSWVAAMAALEPSWAWTGEWFIIALSRNHIYEILDAQIGFASTLVNSRDARQLQERPQQNVAAGLVQGSLAADTLLQWESALKKSGILMEFARRWQPTPQTAAGELGIEIAGGELGIVEVAEVIAGTTADGRLMPGDRIVGLNGRLLEYASPLEDLRAWWESAESGSAHVVRVLRGDAMVDLEITRPFDEVTLSDLLSEPLELLHEMAVICEAISAGTVQVHHTDGKGFSAMVRLNIGGTK